MTISDLRVTIKLKHPHTMPWRQEGKKDSIAYYLPTITPTYIDLPYKAVFLLLGNLELGNLLQEAPKYLWLILPITRPFALVTAAVNVCVCVSKLAAAWSVCVCALKLVAAGYVCVCDKLLNAPVVWGSRWQFDIYGRESCKRCVASSGPLLGGWMLDGRRTRVVRWSTELCRTVGYLSNVIDSLACWMYEITWLSARKLLDCWFVCNAYSVLNGLKSVTGSKQSFRMLS